MFKLIIALTTLVAISGAAKADGCAQYTSCTSCLNITAGFDPEAEEGYRCVIEPCVDGQPCNSTAIQIGEETVVEPISGNVSVIVEEVRPRRYHDRYVPSRSHHDHYLPNRHRGASPPTW